MKSIRESLELGQHKPLRVREETISSHTSPCRVAYVSDIHLRRGRSTHLVSQVIAATRRADPHLILLGGDLVDQLSELPHLSDLIEKLLTIAPVFAIPGNHDVAAGEEKVRATVEAAGASWIQHTTTLFAHGTRTLAISGPAAPDPPPAADLHILCAHNPRVWKTARHRHFHLVLAGHLHGCQAVCFHARDRLFPGALFYPYNFTRRTSGHSTLIVSAGCSDLIPIRWNCPREIVVCLL